MNLRDQELQIIKAAVERHGSYTAAAKALGISPAKIRSRLGKSPVKTGRAAKWTKERIFTDAQGYSSYMAWARNSPYAYRLADKLKIREFVKQFVFSAKTDEASPAPNTADMKLMQLSATVSALELRIKQLLDKQGAEI